MKAPAPSAQRPTVAARFRTEILQAESEGVSVADLVLHLTLGDVGQLKRDRAIPVADISFAGGVMRYLGVKVIKGDVAASFLRRTPAESA